MTQNQMILEHLKSGKTITGKEAMELYGCMRLSARIHDLRERGYKIYSQKVTQMNRFGKMVSFDRYKWGAENVV